ncbi:MAG: N-acetylmuramoyl-L-alanine amidase [Verrucomicrobia bacterium]|nr:N-acetylmuramoyl-L-alanine amidase [Verrucomicrobiota bacterium]
MSALRSTFASILVIVMAALLASCETPPQGSIGRSSSGLNEYGNRPGPRGFSTVIVDAGHGGKDSGASSRRTGLTEKTLTLDMAKRLRSELGGFRVVMMRDSDTFVDLDDRVRIANRYPDGILVSLHFNESPPSIAGPETYWWRVDSYTLAKRVQSHISAVADQHNSRGLVRRRLRLTRNPMIPCILIECGYISNSREGKAISNSSYRNKLASAIASAIREQAAYGDGNLGPLPPFIKAPPSRHGDSRGS